MKCKDISNAVEEMIERKKLRRPNEYEVEDEEDDELVNFDCSKTDIKERYLKLIFEPYRFSRTNIFKALGVC